MFTSDGASTKFDTGWCIEVANESYLLMENQLVNKFANIQAFVTSLCIYSDSYKFYHNHPNHGDRSTIGAEASLTLAAEIACHPKIRLHVDVRRPFLSCWEYKQEMSHVCH